MGKLKFPTVIHCKINLTAHKKIHLGIDVRAKRHKLLSNEKTLDNISPLGKTRKGIALNGGGYYFGGAWADFQFGLSISAILNSAVKRLDVF